LFILYITILRNDRDVYIFIVYSIVYTSLYILEWNAHCIDF